jgi:hypothetical protein
MNTQLFLTLMPLLLAGCKDTVVNPVDRIVGQYKAVTFIVLGSRDEPVDVLKYGGTLTAKLESNFRVEGRVTIPPDANLGWRTIDTTYSGTFTLKADTLTFKDTQTLLDRMPFLVQERRLATPILLRIPFKIILEKQ